MVKDQPKSKGGVALRADRSNSLNAFMSNLYARSYCTLARKATKTKPSDHEEYAQYEGIHMPQIAPNYPSEITETSVSRTTRSLFSHCNF